MLFDEVSQIVASYPNGVLSVVDETGYPLSVRCQPRADTQQQGLCIMLPDKLPIQAGAASLLFHSHDELLNQLKSVTVQGALVRQGDEWFFKPERVIPGMGRSGFFAVLQDTLLTPRRNAKRYLAKRGLARPRIPWDKLRKLIEE